MISFLTVFASTLRPIIYCYANSSIRAGAFEALNFLCPLCAFVKRRRTTIKVTFRMCIFKNLII